MKTSIQAAVQLRIVCLLFQVRTPEVSKDMTLLVPGQMAPQQPTQEQATSRRKRKASVGEVTRYKYNYKL